MYTIKKVHYAVYTNNKLVIEGQVADKANSVHCTEQLKGSLFGEQAACLINIVHNMLYIVSYSVHCSIYSV